MVVKKTGQNFVDGSYSHISSEQYLNQRSTLREVTPQMSKAVSGHRREKLEEEMATGGFKSYAVPEDTNGPSKLGNVTYSSVKVAASGSTGIGMTGGYRGAGDSLVQNPNLYHPLLSNSKMNLPREQGTINAWSRIFVATNGPVQNAVTLHSTYPISKLNIKCKDPADEAFWGEMIEDIDLMNICISIAQEYWTLGEAFIYAELDESNAKWSRLRLQNPDYVDVQPSVVTSEPILSLRPDANLKNICTSTKPFYQQQRQMLDPSIIEYVKRGQNIPLDNYHVTAIQRKISANSIRGTGLIVSNFHNLMLLDKLRESKFFQADNLINPLTLVKVGSDGTLPTAADLEGWRDVFQSAQNDHDFKIFTHDKVTVERVGANGGIIDTMADITQLWKEIFSGLMVPSVLMDGGGDVTYANGGVTLDVLRQRYMSFRNMLTIFLRRKIFAPIAKIRDMYEYKDGKKVLRVPDIEWNHMSLFDMADYIAILKEMATGEKKTVSVQTLYRSLGLSWEDEQHKIRQEEVAEAILVKERKELIKMSLTELRALAPGDEIQESPYQKTMGEEDPAEGEEGAGEEIPGMTPPPAPPA